MPSWAIHLGVTTKINEKIKLTESRKKYIFIRKYITRHIKWSCYKKYITYSTT